MASEPDPDAEAADALGRAIEEMAAAHVQSVADALDVNLAFRTLLEHETARAESVGADQPRAIELRALLDAQSNAVRELRVLQERFLAEVPEVAGEDALLHGRVVDTDGVGIGRLDVSLTNRAGTAVDYVPKSTTAPHGYFSFTITRDVLEKMAKAGAYLAVATPSGRIVYRSVALQLAPGSRTIHNIRLDRRLLLAPKGKAKGRGPAEKGRPAGRKR